ncbi:MAG TPA: SPFH domain-containing protein [Anaerolineae bacterium]|nr:SPFH domain-containing protein [Anaerolineae bacterium]
MRMRPDRFSLGIEGWATRSVYEQPGQRARLRGHIERTLLRFGLLMATLVILILLSGGAEYLRHRIGGTPFSLWRLLGGLLPGLAGLVAMLAVSAAFVREVYDIRNWRSALNYVWLLLFGRAPLSLFGLIIPGIPLAPYPYLIVREGRIGEKYENTPLARLGGPGNAIIFNDSAVILERFGRLIHLAGPGAVFLRRFERIREVVDLRPQERSLVAEALTKDGIPVQTEVQVRFRLEQLHPDPSPPTPDTPRQIRQRALAHAGRCHARLIDLDTGRERVFRWPERVMGNVDSTLRAIVANYRLDELLEPLDPNQNPRRKIGEQLHKELDSAARNFGARVLEVRMGPLEPTLEEVREERVVSWQADRRSEARKERARGEAEAIREEGLARAYAQMEIILTLAREFQEVVEHDVALSAEFVALRFIEALRQAWSRPGGALVSLEALRTLDYLQQLVKRVYTLPSGEAKS